ncbi:MAG: hypothetical protein JWM80_1637 [Cyanobacteria bacterium RYN_339]|nr:hypothetical protein [Cyanobacteria bacterium RYN_339]
MDDIHGLKPFMFFAPSWKLLLLAGFAIVAMGLLATWFLKSRPAKPLPALPVIVEGPPASVRAQLDQLAAGGMLETGRVRDFHASLSTIVRAYLGQKFGLPGRRFTTTELLSALANGGIAQEPLQLVSDLLPRCDLAKFADFRPGRADMDHVLREAYRLVDLLGDDQTPVEEPEESFA